MPRTTATAKKSTGAHAPRIMVSIPAQKVQLALRARKKETLTKLPHDSEQKHEDIVTITVRPSVLTRVLTVEIMGPINLTADMDKDHDEWCTACFNGGTCFCCDFCLRVVCSRCVSITENEDTASSAFKFKCPWCHLDVGPKGPTIAPYMMVGKPDAVVYTGKNSHRESFLRCISEPLAVISITLEGMPDTGPAKLVYNRVVSYLRGNAAYINIDFNFGSSQASDSFIHRLNTLVDLFETGDMCRFRRFSIFLTTHSDPERGDLHVVPNEQGAAPLNEVFHAMIAETRFGGLLQQSRDSVLTLVACGSVAVYREPLNALRYLSAQKFFRQILAFTQPNLQSSFIENFLLDYSLNRFIHLKEKVTNYIINHQTLGAHTSLVIVDVQKSESTVTELFWAHRGRQPFGQSPPVQCPDCLSLKPWQPSESDDRMTIIHTCKNPNCRKIRQYNPIPGATTVWLPGPKLKSGEHDVTGRWWVRISGDKEFGRIDTSVLS